MDEQTYVPNDKLRHERRKRFLTLDAAAKMINVSVTSFGRWERGVQTPHLETIGKICQAFNVTPEEIGYGNLQD